MVRLTHEELKRYDRQVRIPALGREGQSKLKNSSILIAGVGGLGSAAALYLTAAGVGKIKLVDYGEVKLSNLNRQILYSTEDVGRPKALRASQKLRELNPEIEVIGIHERITESNIGELLNDVDLVVDGQDNFKTRFIINDECVRRKIPFIHAAVYMLEGRLMTIIPNRGPCLRCLIPRPPAEVEINPILGSVAGILGSLEALEAVKVLTGIGEPAVGRLIIIDGEELSFHTIRVERSSDCPICGE